MEMSQIGQEMAVFQYSVESPQPPSGCQEYTDMYGEKFTVGVSPRGKLEARVAASEEYPHERTISLTGIVLGWGQTTELDVTPAQGPGTDEPILSIAEEAEKIINGARAEAYGPVEESFNQIAGAWSALFGVELTAKDVALAMIMLKVCRESGPGHTRDSLVDIVGYTLLLEKVEAARD